MKQATNKTFSPIDRENNFDLIRLYAAINVVVSHAIIHLHLPGRAVWDYALVAVPGVPIFFMISGFLVTESFLRSQGVGRFAWKRAVRIYPLLTVNILTLEVLMILTGGSEALASPLQYFRFLVFYVASASDALAATITGFRPGMDFTAFFPHYPSGVLWTLSVELSFYVLLAILLSVFVWTPSVGFLILFLSFSGSIALAMFGDVTVSWKVEHFTLPYFWIFGLGVFARVFWPRIQFIFQGTFVWWLAGYAALCWALLEGGSPLRLPIKSVSWETALKMMALCGLSLSAAFTLPSLARRLLHGHDLSYGIYLWHMLVITSIVGAGYSGNWWLWGTVAAGTLALAASSWLAVERPAIKMKIWEPRLTALQKNDARP